MCFSLPTAARRLRWRAAQASQLRCRFTFREIGRRRHRAIAPTAVIDAMLIAFAADGAAVCRMTAHRRYGGCWRAYAAASTYVVAVCVMRVEIGFCHSSAWWHGAIANTAPARWRRDFRLQRRSVNSLSSVFRPTPCGRAGFALSDVAQAGRTSGIGCLRAWDAGRRKTLRPWKCSGRRRVLTLLLAASARSPMLLALGQRARTGAFSSRYVESKCEDGDAD